MQRYLSSFFALSLMIGMAGSASAQGADAPMIPLPPKPDLAPMTFLVGTWDCENKSARRPTSSKATTTYVADPTGYWIVGTTKSPGVPWYPYPAVMTDRITYDASTKRWIDISTDDTGGYDFSTAPGWTGNKLVWSDVTYSKGGDIASSSDTTYTKVSDTKTTYTSSFTTTAGKSVGVTGSCLKT